MREPELPATQAAEPLTLDHDPSPVAEVPTWAGRITVREFFATLGAARAPMDVSRLESTRSERTQPVAPNAEESKSEAAQQAAPQPEAAQPAAAQDDSTPATLAPPTPQPEEKAGAPVVPPDDSFSRLFADSPVSPEDNRAASALSGAVAHEHGLPSIDMPSGLQPSRDLAATPDRSEPPQESEEDLRRFREWLDGLTES
jgi:hypothetical protein